MSDVFAVVQIKAAACGLVGSASRRLRSGRGQQKARATVPSGKGGARVYGRENPIFMALMFVMHLRGIKLTTLVCKTVLLSTACTYIYIMRFSVL